MKVLQKLVIYSLVMAASITSVEEVSARAYHHRYRHAATRHGDYGNASGAVLAGAGLGLFGLGIAGAASAGNGYGYGFPAYGSGYSGYGSYGPGYGYYGY